MKTNYIFVLLLGIILLACGNGQKNQVPADSKLKLANAYYTNGLYQSSVNEYLEYIENYPVDVSRQANTYYTIANIYFERINDYEKALEYFFRIKYLYPESTVQSEVGKKIVSCLERLQKSGDAARVLEQEASLNKDNVEEHRPGKILAEIGSRTITQGDLDFEISKLPAYIQEGFKDKNQKSEFLKQFIIRELLYDSAKRQQLDQDKDVIEGTFRSQKALMAEKLLQQELQNEVNIDPDDIELYFMAHKDKYTEKDEQGKVTRQKTFNEVQQQVAQDLAMERQQQAYQKLAERLMKAENVKLYETRIQ